MTSQADQINPGIPVNKLPKGGRVGVISPSAVFSEKKLEAGLNCLRAMGFEVEHQPLVGGKKENLFAAGSVQERLEQIHALLRQDEIHALVCIRGGYGSAELLPGLDFELFARKKIPLVGFSDNTALLVNLTERTGVITFHGAQIASAFASADEIRDCNQSASSLISLLMGDLKSISYGAETLKHGKCQSTDGQIGEVQSTKGQLLAGNLTMLCSLLGTPWDVTYSNKVLVLEEVSEAPYRVHRLLMQLLSAGKLHELAALCFGIFTKDEKTREAVESFVENYLSSYSYPVLMGLPVGHDDLNLPLPIGAQVEVSADKLTVVSKSVD